MNEMFLARGKLKYDNLPHKKGDWVYGNYVELKDGDRTMCCIYGYGEIIPETVGQYIGKLDKNGKRIFEGDICDVAGERCVIIYRRAAFFADFGNYCPYLNDVATENFEVVGNIYDNPKLIGGKENG